MTMFWSQWQVVCRNDNILVAMTSFLSIWKKKKKKIFRGDLKREEEKNVKQCVSADW